MDYQAFLIKYAEIGVKGKNRHLFEEALVRQIVYALDKVEGSFRTVRENGRIYVLAEEEFDYSETVEALKHVFGISAICPVVQLQDEGFEVLREKVVDFMNAQYPGGNYSFKVHCRRARKNYPMRSQEMNAELGDAILRAVPSSKVDVHSPDVYVYVEVRDHQINVYSISIPGAG
ncbi:MAG: tRNA 4-thiouridine(8) synthase ThiI, partial [Parasporobacterium sp.]|nr:tRNA 4-thiouridine(8) synthase ThiI [Parasporobacterium sp.]